MKKLKASFLFLALVCGANAFAFVSPLSLSVLPPVEFPPEDFGVTGVRVSLLWGEHRQIYGLDFGLLGNITEQVFVGIGVSGLFNVTTGQTTAIGLQFAGVTNYNTNKTNVYGLQLAGLFNYNEAESSVNGLQMALFANIGEHTTIRGFQVGLYNRALDVKGMQIGLVNVADSLHGLQIGLINFNHKGTFAVSPFLNVGF